MFSFGAGILVLLNVGILTEDAWKELSMYFRFHKSPRRCQECGPVLVTVVITGTGYLTRAA